MNILVTGANGQLGNEMRIISKDTDDCYTFTDVVEVEDVETTILDITDTDAVKRMVKEKNIQCIVNCAAYTNVDKAESDETLCRKLNAEAPRILAEAMKEAGGMLVQISTDYVFAVSTISLAELMMLWARLPGSDTTHWAFAVPAPVRHRQTAISGIFSFCLILIHVGFSGTLVFYCPSFFSPSEASSIFTRMSVTFPDFPLRIIGNF